MTHKAVTKRGQAIALVALAVGLLTQVGCNKDSEGLGMGLQDPSTLYEGVRDTVSLSAYTFWEDSLLTSLTDVALVGRYDDPVMGSVVGSYYTRILIPSQNNNDVVFDANCRIDSVVLSLAISSIFPSPSASESQLPLHFRVDQLAESPDTSTNYYSTDSLPLSGTCFFDGTTQLEVGDTMAVTMRLDESIHAYFANQTYSPSEFASLIKGIRLQLLDGGQPRLLGVNLLSQYTYMRVYYTYLQGGDSVGRTLDLSVGFTARHFSRYEHHYAGPLATFNTHPHDSIAGDNEVYLLPMGGTYVQLRMQPFVSAFHAAHPYATIHYAELKVPVALTSDTTHPSRLQAVYRNAAGELVNIPDMTNSLILSGYDGTDTTFGYYRLRVTQYFQHIVSSGTDNGTRLYLDARRSDARRLIGRGTDAAATGGDNIRIEFVYSEP